MLDELASLGGKPIETLSPEVARQQPTPTDAVKSLLRKDGSTLPVELSLIMWVEPGTDRPAGFASIMRDISQRKQLEEERNAYASRLEEQLAAIQATSDGISSRCSALLR